jgi:hypothetical protein
VQEVADAVDVGFLRRADEDGHGGRPGAAPAPPGWREKTSAIVSQRAAAWLDVTSRRRCRKAQVAAS